MAKPQKEPSKILANNHIRTPAYSASAKLTEILGYTLYYTID